MEIIQDLLVLQERKQQLDRLETELGRLPEEMDKLRAAIRAEEVRVETVVESIREMEVKRGETELEIESLEEQIARYKTQQLQVKKNDEYQALTHEIELNQEKIGGLETAELELMEAIDEKNRERAELEIETAKRIDYQSGLIRECEEKLENLKSRQQEARDAYAEQVSKTDPELVQTFENLVDQIKRPPYVAEIIGQNCGGCHMRVSNDSLKKAKMGNLASCDQCARVVYVDI